MKVLETSEKALLDLIATGEKIIVKVWMENCPKCDEYKPVFEKVAEESPLSFLSFLLPPLTMGSSEFKKKYMKIKVGESLGAPATFVFEKGEMLYRHFGKMDEAQLKDFIGEGKAPVNQAELAHKELIGLFARRGEITMLMDELPMIDAKIREIKKFLGAP